MQSISELLGTNGPLAKHISGFASRSQQQAMAETVAETLEKDGLLIAEAGTGTGKTFAYLVPALLCGKKVMISTGTKNLQDQLFGVSTSIALLKGRANYLCHHRLEMLEGRRMRPEQQDQLARVRSWTGRTRSGDTAELGEIPEDSSIWPMVTSTTDNCLGSECPAYSECFVMNARKEAQAADVLVVNHHLFFADMALRDEGFGEILPGVNAFIFDEAHQLPEVASVFFGLNLGGRQIIDLGRDTLVELHNEAPDQDLAQACVTKLEKTVRDFRLALGTDTRRGPWAKVAESRILVDAADDLLATLIRLEEVLEPLAERGKGLERCWRRCLELQKRFGQFVDGSEQNYIQWFETHSRSFVLHMTPLDIHETFRAYIDKHRSAWIFTSATLAVGDGQPLRF